MSSDINVQTFSGKVNITSNLLVGSSHLFVDTINNRVGLVTNTPTAGLHVESNTYVRDDFRVGSGIVMNVTPGQITAGAFHGTFVGDGSAMTGINSDSGSWVNGVSSNVHLATIGDKVGIGVVEPLYKLDVDGDINFTGALKYQGSDFVSTPWNIHTSPDALSYTAGNIGIGGAASATNTLKVTGTVEATTGFTGTATNATNVTLAASDTDVNHSVTFSSGATGSQALKTDPGLVYNPSTNILTTSVSGSASSAGNATKVTVVASSTAANHSVTFSSGATGSQALKTDPGLVYNPSTNILTTSVSGSASSAGDADTVDGQHAHEMSWGHDTVHTTYGDFNTFLNTDKFGAHFAHLGLNGPGGHAGAGSQQWYHQRMSLGSEYNQYSLQLAIPRNRTDSYLYYRNEEANTPTTWYKMRAGYADSSGSITSQANSATITATSANTANQICQRDGVGDITCRLFRSGYGNETHGFHSAGFAYRVSTSDNYIRFCTDMNVVRTRLGCAYMFGASSTDFSIAQLKVTSIRAHTGSYYTRLTWPNNGHHVDCYLGTSGHEFHINYYAQATVYLNRSGYSDRRIKEDIKDVDDVSALTILRKIKPKTYKYKLQPHKGTVYGFIAQDVREVLPYATNLTKLSAPFDREKFVNATILEDGMVNLSGPCNDLEIGKMAHFYYESRTSTRDFEVTEIISPTQFRVRVGDDESEWIGNTMLVGKEVNDFHGIDKDAIFTVATAALQEVDRQLQAEKIKTYELRQKVELLEMSHGALIQRVEALEKL